MGMLNFLSPPAPIQQDVLQSQEPVSSEKSGKCGPSFLEVVIMFASELGNHNLV